MSETKICPYCGEEILSVAKKCRYCGEWLEPIEEASENEEQQTDLSMGDELNDQEMESLVDEEDVSEPIAERLERVIRNYMNSHLPQSKQIYFLDQIPERVLEGHKKYYAPIKDDEKVLLAINTITPSLIKASTPGLCITDKFLYYKLLRSTSLAALYLTQKKGVIPLSSIDDISLGEMYYRGGPFFAEFLVNGESIGALQFLGFIGEDDEKELSYIFENL